MTQRNSLNDICDVYISRRKNAQPGLGRSLLYDLRSSWDHLLLSQPNENCPRLPLPKPGCGCSTNAAQKPSRYGQSLRIPRPRNAFILFRCDFVHQRKVNPTENEDNNISRAAGQLWSQMTLLEKQPWLRMAQREKECHALLYPNYKYSPNPLTSKLRKAKIRGFKLNLPKAMEPSALDPAPPVNSQPQPPQSRVTSIDEQINSYPLATRPHPYLPQRRPSSCPPIGAAPVLDLQILESWLPLLVSQDDLRRRPSQVVMYQSMPAPSAVEPAPSDHLPLPQKDGPWFGVPQSYPWEPTLNELLQHSPGGSEIPAAPALTDSNPVDAVFSKQLDALSDMEHLSLDPGFVDPFQFSPKPADSYPSQASDVSPFVTFTDMELSSSTLPSQSGFALLSKRRGGFSAPSQSTLHEDA